MVVVDRMVVKDSDTSDIDTSNQHQPLSDYRENVAWILLGEPGAGKSTSLMQEANSSSENTEFLSIAEFLFDFSDDELKGKTLFLDGLDEIRASTNDGTVLLKVKNKLRRLGSPKFRIACRAADWLGSSDSDDLKSVSQNNEITRLLISPLSNHNIESILKENYNIVEPNNFIRKAERFGVYHLLENPQTLEMLVKAVSGDRWPESRIDTFQLACEKLVDENNKRHRDLNRFSTKNKQALLDAAGQLFSVMMLAGKDGIALDQSASTTRFPYLNDFFPPKIDVAYDVLHKNLFRIEREELLKPSHRSIAEYLSGTWLAKQIDCNGLPLRRVLNLLIGEDGRTVSDLRGLYGWFAIQCKNARTRLIKADSLTVVGYGDAKLLPETDKRNILSELKNESEELTSFHRYLQRATPLGSLADPSLSDVFVNAFIASDRDNASQSYVDCILTILKEGESLKQLTDHLINIIKDNSWWSLIRTNALDIWLKYTNDANKAKTLLDEINLQQLRDSDDELKAILLRFLYPNYLSINQLFDYLHLPKTKHLFGTYLWFWEHDFAEHCPDDHLIIALSIFINNQEKVDLIAQSYHFRQMVSRITARSISVHGDKVTDEVLYSWLDFVSNKNDQLTMDSEDINEVEKWLSERPDRYKQLLKYYIEVNKTAKTITMYDFKNAVKFPRVPDDYGAWCLNQIIDETNQDIVKIYLSEAVSTLILQRGNDNMSLELLEQWALGNIVRQKILNTYLVWEVDTRYRKNSKIRYDREKDWEEKKRVRTTEFNKQFSKIKSGIASVQIMYQLAYVWKGLFVDISGETIQERFDNYVENGSQLLNVAKQGFIASPERSDIPTVKDIISLSIQRKEYYISHPCLIGMELRWEQGMKSINTLVNDSLQCMVAFNLTLLNDKTPEWLTFLAKTKPELVAEVYSKYAVAHVKLKSSSISLLHQLENNAEYSELAVRVVPHILDKFPIRVNRDQLYNLKYLLRSAINNTKSVIPKIIDKKLLKKSLTASQKVYYLAAGVIADPDKFESQLWQFVGNSKSKLNHLAEFLDSRHADSSIDSKLTPYSIGQLIENLMPYADISMTTGDGKVTGAMRYGNQIKSLIRKLSNMNTIGTEKELDRLVKNPLLKNLKYTLEDARYQVRQKRRETSFSYLSVTDVASVITNNKPTNAADLNALVLHHLDDINNDIHNDNDDGFAKYWNIDRHRKPESKRVENACRDELLTRLRNKLNPLGIDCEPEGDYSNDKRADIRISYKNMIEIPVEAKRDDNDELWEACTSQLVKQYTIAPKAKGFGIYIVFWFGKGDIRKPIDGSDKPKSAEELEYKLEKILGNENYERITVKVIDVSWP